MEPVTYSGSRTIEDLVAFIKEHGAHKVDAYEGKNETEKAEEKKKKKKDDSAESVVEEAADATEGVKDKVTSAVKEAVESAKAVVQDTDDEVHDEL